MSKSRPKPLQIFPTPVYVHVLIIAFVLVPSAIVMNFLFKAGFDERTVFAIIFGLVFLLPLHLLSWKFLIDSFRGYGATLGGPFDMGEVIPDAPALSHILLATYSLIGITSTLGVFLYLL